MPKKSSSRKNAEPTSVERLPSWAAALIVFVVSLCLVIYLSGIALIVFTKRTTERSLDPKHIVKVAKDVAQFPDPLPEGFAMVFGIRVGPVSIVTIEHRPDKQEITMASEQKATETNVKDLLKQAYDMGVNLPSGGFPAAAHFKAAKSSGEVEVAGEKMPYLIGELDDGSSQKREGFVGAILSKAAKKSILIFGIKQSDGPYDIDETLNFLRSLRGF